MKNKQKPALSPKEQGRVEAIRKAAAREIRQREAAALLALSVRRGYLAKL